MGARPGAPGGDPCGVFLLALQRQLPLFMDQQQPERLGPRAAARGHAFADQTTIAVLGFGHIGREIARLLRALRRPHDRVSRIRRAG